MMEDITGSMRFNHCTVCHERVVWIDCPTGGWWAHDVHPSDDHDAEVEGDNEVETFMGFPVVRDPRMPPNTILLLDSGYAWYGDA